MNLTTPILLVIALLSLAACASAPKATDEEIIQLRTYSVVCPSGKRGELLSTPDRIEIRVNSFCNKP